MKNQKHLISVIVPVYKVEPYVRKCIDSILAQTYTNLEIILVDDGSPDRCPEICDEYAARDSRIKVIHKENGGLSDARNAGIDTSTGDYLMFVDSDDWLELSAVEDLYHCALIHDADLVIGCQCIIDHMTGNVIACNQNKYIVEKCIEKQDAMSIMLQHGWTAWARLYKVGVHKNVSFPVGRIYEDEAVALSVLENCNKIVRLNTIVYNYRKRPESITTSVFSEKNLDSYRNAKNDLVWIREKHPELEQQATLRYYSRLLLHILEIAAGDQRYWNLGNELHKELQQNYKVIKKIFRENNKETYKLEVLNILPYPIYCRLVKIYYKLRYHK
ncbi:MAG: glycosyltransferase [Clostridia bacterium]|nr:glycosyltransferase [Clostridia bacterium]